MLAQTRARSNKFLIRIGSTTAKFVEWCAGHALATDVSMKSNRSMLEYYTFAR